MTDMISFAKSKKRLLKAVDRATNEAQAIPVAFLIVYAEPGGQDVTMFHFKVSVINQYFRDKSECFSEALINTVNEAVAKCFKAEKVYDA